MPKRLVDRSIALNAGNLRGLAHPVRVQILNILAIDGPSTSSGLAERLQVRSGSTSWHLHKLAEHGFIEEIPERGNKRERWWRAIASGYSVNAAEFLDDPELAGPVSTVLLEQMRHEFQRAATFIGEDWPRAWNDAWIFNRWDDLYLTPEKLLRLRNEIWELIRRYREDSDDGDPNARPVAMQIQGFPYLPGTAE